MRESTVRVLKTSWVLSIKDRAQTCSLAWTRIELTFSQIKMQWIRIDKHLILMVKICSLLTGDKLKCSLVWQLDGAPSFSNRLSSHSQGPLSRDSSLLRASTWQRRISKILNRISICSRKSNQAEMDSHTKAFRRADLQTSAVKQASLA